MQVGIAPSSVIFAKRKHSEFAADVPLEFLAALIGVLEHSFKLAVEMDLVAAKSLQLVRIECLAERLLANQRPVRQFLLPVIEPRRTSTRYLASGVS